jgi:excisionase family DNA binding protein
MFMEIELLSGWMTPASAASLLGLREDYVRLLINTNKLAARKLGKQWFVHQHSVRKYSRNMSKQKQLELKQRLEGEEA